MTMILVFSILAMVVGIVTLLVALAAFKRYDLLEVRLGNFERAYVHHYAIALDQRRKADDAIKSVATGLARTINELCFVRDQFYATQSQPARSLQPEGAQGSGEAPEVPSVPARHLQVIPGGRTLTDAVRTAEAAGVRADGDHAREEVSQ